MKICPVCQREFPVGVTHCNDDGVALVALNNVAQTRPEELVGQVVEGRYKVEKVIGRGGMGTVYSCRHVVVGKVAAMKVLRGGVDHSEGVLQRFVREAQTANLINSRHIVEMTDFGQLPNGAFFVVMELLEGLDLAKSMRKGLQRAELIHVFQQVAETLQLAHDKGIVHRDLKPDNVFLVQEAGDPLFVKLLDFGIAKIVHGEPTGGLTETGVILGTPYYMSPEQARAENIDHRTDIYALGVMMYRAFTGRLPFIADSTMGVLTRHLTEPPERPSRLGNVDLPTERMILRCMEKRREDRFQSMRELLEVLRSLSPTPMSALHDTSTKIEGMRVPGHDPSQPSGAHPAYPYATGQHPNVNPYATGQHAAAQAAAMYGSGQHPAVQTYQGAQVVMPHYGTGQHPAMTPQAAAAMTNPAMRASSAPGAAYPAAQAQFYATGQNPMVAAPQPGFDPRLSSQPAGFDPRVSSGPGASHPGMSPAYGYAQYPQGPISEPVTTVPSLPPPPEGNETAATRGLSATSQIRLQQPKKSPIFLVVGALMMAAAGAAGAYVVYGRGSGAGPAAGGTSSAASPTVTATAAPVTTTTASTAPVVSAAPTASVTASAAAPVASASAAAAADTAKKPPSGPVGQGVAAPVGPGRVPAPPVAPPAGSAPTPKHRTDIRSPFD